MNAVSTPLFPDHHILLGKGETHQTIALEYANRHGLIAGATGTGKTVTLQVLAEGFSNAGVPVFVADVKGDLSGIATAGAPHKKVDERVEHINIDDFSFQANPTIFWDMYGEQGHPIRITISEMGPILLSRLLDLTPAQEGVLTVVFAVADDQGLLLLDFEDLQAAIHYVAQEAKTISVNYGLVSSRSIAALQRKLLQFEQDGGNRFFGEPALDIKDFMRTNRKDKGYINVLVADKLMHSPLLYSTFLLWLLSELFETLPEVGDPDKPSLVFFFDEAHLLFDNAPKALLSKVEQVCRLIRSKGVGVYFVTQNPQDIPGDVLGQLGNRVQHALRAFTPKEQKAVKVAAQSFRPNPAYDTQEIITMMGVGEALISCLQDGGIPSIVERTLVRPPASRIGPLTDEERQRIVDDSPVLGVYDEPVDRESAAEMLAERAKKAAQQVDAAPATTEVKTPDSNASSSEKETTFVEKMLARSLKYASAYILRRITLRVTRGILGGLLK